MAELADHAWSHALAVLDDPAQASEVARTAVRRGGRSRSGALAHARHEALAIASDEVVASEEPAPDDLLELARRLTNYANDAGGSDNITVVLVDVPGPEANLVPSPEALPASATTPPAPEPAPPPASGGTPEGS